MTRSRYLLHLLFVSAGLLFVLWLGGLILFVAQIGLYVERPVSDDLPQVDAIVVLTGGSERIQTGLDLLRAGKGEKLFISGVHPGVSLEHMIAKGELKVPEELRACCVILGHAADNTLGNAEETRAFLLDEGYTSLRLVTSNYHMPRSLLVFHRLMPEVEILPHPVAPDIVDLNAWWKRLGTASLLIGEYNKYLYAQLRAALGVL